MTYARLADLVRTVAGLCHSASPFSFAARFQLEFEPAQAARDGAEIVGRRLRWNPRLPLPMQRMAVAREICRWLLEVYDMASSQPAIASFYAVMFPYDVPVSFSLPSLRLIRSQLAPTSTAAYRPAQNDRRPARGARRR